MTHAPIVHEHHHGKRHKSLPERYQTAIACTVLAGLMFATIYVVAVYVPVAPLPDNANSAPTSRLDPSVHRAAVRP